MLLLMILSWRGPSSNVNRSQAFCKVESAMLDQAIATCMQHATWRKQGYIDTTSPGYSQVTSIRAIGGERVSLEVTCIGFKGGLLGQLHALGEHKAFQRFFVDTLSQVSLMLSFGSMRGGVVLPFKTQAWGEDYGLRNESATKHNIENRFTGGCSDSGKDNVVKLDFGLFLCFSTQRHATQTKCKHLSWQTLYVLKYAILVHY